MDAGPKIHNGENYHIRAANEKMIPIVAELQVIIRLKDYVSLGRFVVCKTLPCHIFFGTEFQDSPFEITNHKEQFYELPNGQRLPIVRNGSEFITETNSKTIGCPDPSRGFRRKDC